jgi:DNA replication licensing factor MCM4
MENFDEVLDTDLKSDIKSSTQTTQIFETVIWGTNINMDDTKILFIKFIKEYTVQINDNFERKYLNLLDEISITQENILNIDCTDMFDYNQTLYSQLIRYPQEIIPLMDYLIDEIFHELYSDVEMSNRIQVRVFNLKEVHHMRLLDPQNIDQLICIRGMVTRCSGSFIFLT